MKKTTRITMETERVLTLRCGSLGRMWCEHCSAEVETISLEAIASLPGIPPKIQQWIDSGALHCAGTEPGPVRPCQKSLFRLLGSVR
jgi:hypothetical protein